ncbi:MAG: LLM class flavin-dependent oxidoreductase [Chloroflexi bacterium]|nr:LLM class flavin-dependent oxidoreductase [Chloroflexota bacterium]
MAVSQSPESIEFAAERGYPMLQATTATLANIKKKFAYYRECAARAGHDVTNVPLPVTRAINVAENGDEARAEMTEPLEWYLGYARQVGLPATDRGDRVFDEAYKHWKDTRGAFKLDPTEVAENLGIIGSADECGAKLQTLRSELGLNYLNCAFGVGGAPQERILRSMRLFAERVMPQFRSAPAEVGV